jgi:hypothetical protein
VNPYSRRDMVRAATVEAAALAGIFAVAVLAWWACGCGGGSFAADPDAAADAGGDELGAEHDAGADRVDELGDVAQVDAEHEAAGDVVGEELPNAGIECCVTDAGPQTCMTGQWWCSLDAGPACLTACAVGSGCTYRNGSTGETSTGAVALCP